MKKTAPISFRIKPGLKEDLVKLAAAERRSLSLYIELVLEAHVDAAKKRKAKDRPR